MEIIQGYLYFVSDSFFEKVSDPFLKINYQETKRPHYFAIREQSTTLYWLVPCSTRIEKYKKIIAKRQEQKKPTYGIGIHKIQGVKNALLFQDMFPVLEKYIQEPYVRNNQLVCIANPNTVKDIESNARTVISLLRRGTKFTPSQPDVLKIERLMKEELEGQIMQATPEH